MKKIKLKYPLLVEGSYDKNRVSAVAEGTVITSDGFGVFNSAEKRALLRRITEKGKLIVLTDSDGAGALIRGKLKGYLNAENVINLYIPRIEGKEKRKKAPSKDGFLGVEGMSSEVLLSLLRPFAETEDERKYTPVNGACLYALGLTGGKDSSAKRAALCRAAGLPEDMSAKAFSEAVNVLGGCEYLNTLIEDAKV